MASPLHDVAKSQAENTCKPLCPLSHKIPQKRIHDITESRHMEISRPKKSKIVDL